MLWYAMQTLNLTTNSVEFVLEGHLPLGEVLAGLTGLKTLDIRSHQISGEWYLVACGCLIGPNLSNQICQTSNNLSTQSVTVESVDHLLPFFLSMSLNVCAVLCCAQVLCQKTGTSYPLRLSAWTRT